jgi:hypothetical protein
MADDTRMQVDSYALDAGRNRTNILGRTLVLEASAGKATQRFHVYYFGEAANGGTKQLGFKSSQGHVVAFLPEVDLATHQLMLARGGPVQVVWRLADGDALDVFGLATAPAADVEPAADESAALLDRIA